MSRQQIELRTLALVEVVTSGGRIEDVTAEAKTIWPEVKKAPRQLAAHANTARGESLLWIIGLDEDNHEVVGAGDVELAEWWPAVQSAFDEGIAPDLVPVVVPVLVDKTVVALAFTTDRAPYVVKRHTPEGWSERDVPWRDGNRTRSAHRHELLRMLVPATIPPEAEMLSCKMAAWPAKGSVHKDQIELFINGAVFFGPPSTSPVALPRHLMTGEILLRDLSIQLDRVTFDDRRERRHFTSMQSRQTVASSPEAAPTLGVYTVRDAVYVTGPGLVWFVAAAYVDADIQSRIETVTPVEIELVMPVAGSDRPVRIRSQLELQPPSDRPGAQHLVDWKMRDQTERDQR